MKGLYIYYDLTTQNTKAVGIQKKINSQYELFNTIIDEGCDLVNLHIKGSKNIFLRFFKYLFCNNIFETDNILNTKYDYIYIRRIIPNCKAVIHLLKKLKKKNNCKILYELPTYPYDFEHKSFSSKISLFIDKIYRIRLSKYVDRIVTLTDDKEIFGCKTLRITNGVDVKSIPICKKNVYDSNSINLIAVAQFKFWHGYDRVIEGLHKYNGKNVFLHFVGNGTEIEKYKQLVQEYQLQRQVFFHGTLSGKELDEVFNMSDIALCSLGCHRINIFEGSFLKSREYLCRAIPIVTSTKIDIIPDDFDYCLRVPEDESSIDIEKIVKFAKRIYSSDERIEITKIIREFAENNCSMENAMKSVFDYILAVD